VATRWHGSPAERISGPARQQVRRAGVQALWWARSHAFLDRSSNPADTVLVLGSARSGTTWVGEVLDRHRDHRILFEPLRPGAVPAMSAFQGVRYLPPGEPAPAQRAAMGALLSGQVRNPWMDHTNRAIVTRRRLVKEIRANTLAPWLATEFGMCPVVVVVRHPLAVAWSRLALGWTDHLDELLTSEPLREHLGPAALLLEGRTDPLVRAVASWAVETAVPARALAPDQAAIVLYEDLRADPLGAFVPVLAQVGQQLDERLERAVRRPSRTSRPDQAPPSGGVLTADQRAQIGEVLRGFDLDLVYDLDDPAPQAAGLAEIRRRWSERAGT